RLRTTAARLHDWRRHSVPAGGHGGSRMVRRQPGLGCLESPAAAQFSQLPRGHMGPQRGRGSAGARRPALEELRNMILAGDIGGTHTRLAFFDVVHGRFSLVSASVFPSREYAGLDEIVAKFVYTANLRPDTACFGI